MSFVNEFNKEYASKLSRREASFRKVFELLEEKNKDYYVILETGCIRSRDNWNGDGCSTLLWDSFVNFHNGRVYSVDINEQAVELSKQLTSNKTTVTCSNSIPYLWKFNVEIDLLYLDSLDVNFKKPHKSALHHIKELCAVMKNLSRGSIILIDDMENNNGKGEYVVDFMNDICNEKIIDDYQVGWII